MDEGCSIKIKIIEDEIYRIHSINLKLQCELNKIKQESERVNGVQEEMIRLDEDMKQLNGDLRFINKQNTKLKQQLKTVDDHKAELNAEIVHLKEKIAKMTESGESDILKEKEDEIKMLTVILSYLNEMKDYFNEVEKNEVGRERKFVEIIKTLENSRVELRQDLDQSSVHNNRQTE